MFYLRFNVLEGDTVSQTSEESDAPESVRDIVVTGSVSALAVVLFVAGYVLNKRWKNRKHLRRRK